MLMQRALRNGHTDSYLLERKNNLDLLAQKRIITEQPQIVIRTIL